LRSIIVLLFGFGSESIRIPLVNSSYHAADQVSALSVVHRKLYGEVLPVIGK